jgi:hypothetical protein
VRRVTACVTREPAGVLDVAFTLEGDLAALAVPEPGPPAPGERLWEHTCFEIFLRADRARGYHELNVAPWGGWQMHAFVDYRLGGPLVIVPGAPEIAVARAGDRVTLRTRADFGALWPGYAVAPLRVALAAVVEAADGARSYWALRHPLGRPDFHHMQAFALALDPLPSLGRPPT